MSAACSCGKPHQPRRIVLTGGPGAGKTAVLELVRRATCAHVHVLPESAGILFGGGFPRSNALELRRAAQRAIFYVQRELESTAESEDIAIALCDRGTIDSLAYWPGPGDLFASVGTTLEAQLARYSMVIHLRVPPPYEYTHANPLRIETAEEAAAIDARIAAAWARHPRYYEVPASEDFMMKAARAIALLRAEVPECCQPRLATLNPSGSSSVWVGNGRRQAGNVLFADNELSMGGDGTGVPPGNRDDRPRGR